VKLERSGATGETVGRLTPVVIDEGSVRNELAVSGEGGTARGGVIVLGTRETLAVATAQAAASAVLRPRLVGALLVETGRARDRREDAVEGGAAAVRRSAWAGGLPLLGELEHLPAVVDRVSPSLVVVCLPAAMSTLVREVMSALETLGTPYRFLPTIEDVALREPTGPTPLAAGSPAIDLHALVGRPPRTPNEKLIREVVTNKRVLITGAGGSIGSELARICSRFEPELLVLMDRAENSLFDIDRWMREHAPQVSRRTMLHDVVDEGATRARLREVRPHAVFHAAAHKHVPLMQDHPGEALTNNLFGTRSVADAALAAGAERFVFVSTDKAVRPTSVMGATKQLAERYVRAQNEHGQTRFALVRFGNVLGSAASVLPIWASQIAEGGPVTITDPRMTRYFMTIPEAATLVLQAAAVATTSPNNPDLDPADVFVLDMGEPVRIVDLARRFARSLGLTALMDDELARADEAGTPLGPTVAIRVTGSRPGEKLHEQVAHESSQLERTVVPGVFCWRGRTPSVAEADGLVRTLDGCRRLEDQARIIEAIGRSVPDAVGFCARTAA